MTPKERELRAALEDAKAWIIECYGSWAPQQVNETFRRSISTTDNHELRMSRINRALAN